MTVTAGSLTEIARAFADAYRDCDRAALDRLLAPDATIRVLAPPGYEEVTGPAGVEAELRHVYDEWRVSAAADPAIVVLAPNRRAPDDQVRALEHYTLENAAGTVAHMEITHLLRIDADGRIVGLDELCSGIMPVQAASG